MTIKAIIFDYGNVLTFPQSVDYIDKMINILNADIENFNTAYYEHRDLYDGGKVNGVDYWKLVANSLKLEALEEKVLIDLVNIDLDSWYFQNQQMWDFVLSLRKNYKTALLSNNLDELVVKIERDIDLEKYFDVVVFSNKLFFVKPDKRIYEYCLNQLNLESSETIFIDDRQINIDGAEKLGMKGILFKNQKQLLEDLKSYKIII